MSDMSTVRSRGQVTIPSNIRERARIEEGDVVEFELVEDGVLLRIKKLVDASKAWFWTSEWQQMERDAEVDISRGDVEHFESSDELVSALAARAESDAE